ncbi:MAG: preprotein translocase subunit SecG [Bdellovibrionota bacterium]
MQTLITIVHIFTCIFLVLVVLIQRGKGAEISASFSGSSQTVFGSSGGANFFTRFTTAMAVIFMVTSLVLTVLASQSRKSIFETTGGSAQAKPSAAQASPSAVPSPQQAVSPVASPAAQAAAAANNAAVAKGPQKNQQKK